MYSPPVGQIANLRPVDNRPSSGAGYDRIMRRLILFALLALATPLFADVTLRYTADYKLGFSLPQGAAGQIPAASLAALNRPTEIRIKGNKAYQTLGDFVAITNLDTNEVTYLDPAGKRFGTAQADQVASIVAQAMPPVPAQAQSFADLLKADVQSRKTGRTETIHGIAAEEHEIVVSLSIDIPNLPPGNPAMKLVMQMWRAAPAEADGNPALKELARYSNLTASSLSPAEFLRNLTGPMQAFSKSMGPLVEEMTKDKTLVVRTQLEATSPMMAMLAPQLQQQGQALPAGIDPTAPLLSANQEIAELSTDPVDEAVFKIPEGYRKVDIQEILKDQIAAMAGKK